ncbi:hypothetical protein Scep_000851 [Stephania cephalantha]|uniref:Cytochrome b6-f complex subunit 7 n=1 Tax=Stephania cephalantha TaxID=152367 RepID=A0AAP0L9L0_9MAGN
MATASAALSSVHFAKAAIAGTARNGSQRRKANVVYVEGLSAFEGLKSNNCVSSLGVCRSTEHSFAKIVSSLKAGVKGNKGRGGGALSSTCNAAAEIFQIAAIMNGLVLVGVAVGFLLLRIEASVEESE